MQQIKNLDSDSHCIQRVASASTVTTFGKSAARFADGTGAIAQFAYTASVALGPDSKPYAESGNQRIGRFTPDGVVTTLARSTPSLADGTGAVTQFTVPCDVALEMAEG